MKYAERLAMYTNQKVTFESFNSLDQWGESVYDEPKQIRCRIEPKSKYIRTNTGEVITSTSKVISVEELKVKDIIDGKTVIESTAIVDRMGIVVWWEAYI